MPTQLHKSGAWWRLITVQSYSVQTTWVKLQTETQWWHSLQIKIKLAPTRKWHCSFRNQTMPSGSDIDGVPCSSRPLLTVSFRYGCKHNSTLYYFLLCAQPPAMQQTVFGLSRGMISKILTSVDWLQLSACYSWTSNAFARQELLLQDKNFFSPFS